MRTKAGPSASTDHLRGWRIVATRATPDEQPYWASIFTLGNGLLGVRGTREEAAGAEAMPMTLMAEVYDRPARLPGEPRKYRRPSRLICVPNALRMKVRAGDTVVVDPSILPETETRVLDMRHGTLERDALPSHP